MKARNHHIPRLSHPDAVLVTLWIEVCANHSRRPPNIRRAVLDTRAAHDIRKDRRRSSYQPLQDEYHNQCAPR